VGWKLTAEDIEKISIGAGILGTGGGGNPYRGMTRTKGQLELGRTIEIVGMDDLPDDALVVPMGGMGAPTIGLEKIGRGDEGMTAVRELERFMGVEVAATVPFEVGGGNSFSPMIAAAMLELPTVDADGMGRAFPEISMMSFYFDGVAPSPVAMVESQHEKIILQNIPDTRSLERIMRAICVQLGGSATIAMTPIPVARLRETAIPNTLDLAYRIGDTVREAQAAGAPAVDAVCRVTGGRVLFAGKVTDVARWFDRGYNFGTLTLDGLDDYRGSQARIELQNEFLICRIDGEMAAIVPDLITLVDSERGEPITTEVVRYGLRATVIGIPAPPQLTTSEAMEYVGPQAFGYDEPYVPFDPAGRYALAR
jgi:DUF917 family protein